MSQVPFSQLVAQLSVDDALRAEFYDQFEEMFDPSQTDSRAMWQKLMEERPYFATAMVDSFGRDKFGDNYQPHSDPPNQMLDPYRMVESFEGVPTGIESMVSDFLTPLGEEGKMGGGYIFIVGAVDIGTSHTFGALGMDDPDFPPGPTKVR
ncbi:MAG: hypothetical protein QGH82_02680 [Candidatus Woesearchaeota archaeon]|jgi:hypothetical protein|nr:hypothetical protein [Candidatus Woesearchaeota archaeon]